MRHHVFATPRCDANSCVMTTAGGLDCPRHPSTHWERCGRPSASQHSPRADQRKHLAAAATDGWLCGSFVTGGNLDCEDAELVELLRGSECLYPAARLTGFGSAAAVQQPLCSLCSLCSWCLDFQSADVSKSVHRSSA